MPKCPVRSRHRDFVAFREQYLEVQRSDAGVMQCAVHVSFRCSGAEWTFSSGSSPMETREAEHL